MADTKTTALSAFTPILTDLLYGVDDPGGTPVSGKMTIQALLTLIQANLSGATLGGTTLLGGYINMDGAYGFGFEGSNSSGGQIDKGEVVYLDGGSLSINLADANGSGTMPAIGVAAEDIADSSTGVVVTHGFVTGLATDTYTAFDPLYVSETAGALTDTAPSRKWRGLRWFMRPPGLSS